MFGGWTFGGWALVGLIAGLQTPCFTSRNARDLLSLQENRVNLVKAAGEDGDIGRLAKLEATGLTAKAQQVCGIE